MKKHRVHLTEEMIAALDTRDTHYTLWDDDIRRFGVRVTTSGTKTYVIDYTTTGGRRRRQTIGIYGTDALDIVRKRARRRLSSVTDGADPIEHAREERSEGTLKDFVGEYLETFGRFTVKGGRQYLKKPASLRADTYALNEMIVPKLGHLKLSAVRRTDVLDLHRAHASHPVQANRMLATLRHLYALAALHDRVPSDCNPCQGVAKYGEIERERFLSTDELVRLGKVLDKLEPEHPYEVRAVKVLLLTGCRVNEILSLPWTDVDPKGEVLRLKDAKGGPRDVPLGRPALDYLESCDRDSVWVIPSRSIKGRHLVNLSMFWHRDVISAAKLEGVRLHDLRHTVGSVGASAGLSTLMIKGVLGHKRAETAERYSHVARGPLHDAADLISREIAAALNGKAAKKTGKSTRRRK